jgi:hypothetical protein
MFRTIALSLSFVCVAVILIFVVIAAVAAAAFLVPLFQPLFLAEQNIVGMSPKYDVSLLLKIFLCGITRF